jgi:glutamyl-tRNA synthetase
MSGQRRFRFAPSPTGLLHLGNARTALFNWLLSRRHQGRFILRIEDTDLARSNSEAELGIYVSLKWLGIEWDEGPVSYRNFKLPGPGDHGPYRQSERVGIYRGHLERLRELGLAYPCFCAAEELEEERRELARRGQPYRYSGACRGLGPEEVSRRLAEGRTPVWRFRVGRGEIAWREASRAVSFRAEEIGDFVLLRPNGLPTYNFAVTIDDRLMAITDVIRGDDHLANTPKQILLYRAFGWEPPSFVHLPLITGPDHKPLAKRHGAGSLDDLFRQGVLPEAVVNLLALLGWSSPYAQEILERQTLIEQFDLDRITKSPAVFDFQKLTWLNGKHLRTLTPEQLWRRVRPFLQHACLGMEGLPEDWLRRAVYSVRDNLTLCADAVAEMRVYLEDDPEMGAEARALLLEAGPRRVAAAFVAALAPLREPVEEPAIAALLKAVGKSLELRGRELYLPVRAAVSGRLHGPPLPEMISLLGKDRVLRRIAKNLEC